jgi:hypothetical protein
MSLVSAAPAFKKALYAAAVALWAADNPRVYVTYGSPAFDPYPDVVSFGVSSAESDPATIGPRRQREESLTQEVIIYCFRAGGQEQELVALERAYELLGELEGYVRVTDTTLGGVVRECFLTNHASDAATDQDVLAAGRMHVLTATFSAKNRITS